MAKDNWIQDNWIQDELKARAFLASLPDSYRDQIVQSIKLGEKMPQKSYAVADGEVTYGIAVTHIINPQDKISAGLHRIVPQWVHKHAWYSPSYILGEVSGNSTFLDGAKVGALLYTRTEVLNSRSDDPKDKRNFLVRECPLILLDTKPPGMLAYERTFDRYYEQLPRSQNSLTQSKFEARLRKVL
ncbi:MAG: hypothetical protein ACI8Y7_001012 [Candidatus Woesearchaeota archaeon]|jgi:hypothetical protein